MVSDLFLLKSLVIGTQHNWTQVEYNLCCENAFDLVFWAGYKDLAFMKNNQLFIAHNCDIQEIKWRTWGCIIFWDTSDSYMHICY